MNCMNSVREKVVERFEHVLGDKRMSRCLERCVYNWTIKTSRYDGILLFWENPPFMYRYTTKALSLHFNLGNPKNPGLLQRVVNGDMGLKALVNARPPELFPEMWDAVYERVAARQLRKQIGVDIATVPDGAFSCSKCRSKKTTYYQLQTRSSDEPMTTFIQCLNCSKRWKQ